MKDCLFCQIVAGKLPAHKIWEDERHLAFLSIFPNTEGFTVLISKKHYPSNFALVSGKILGEIMIASKKTAQKLIKAFPDTERIGLAVEGEGVDHLHFKLIPMNPESYRGFLTTKEGSRADDKKLAAIARKIKEN